MSFRLTFLYPHLARGFRLEPAAQRRFTTAAPSRSAPFVKRHGKAVQPTPLETDSGEKKATPEGEGEGEGEGKVKKEAKETEAKEAEKEAEKETETKKPETKTQEPSSSPSEPSSALEAVLHMGPPQDQQDQDSRSSGSPPHLSPPPYVHHFDSYSLVKQLEGGGWTAAQAITAMKAVRGLLATNLEVAQAGLESKADVENEAYLFRAACSELATEVRGGRRRADAQTRQQRTMLQHEVDILAQRLAQESQTLGDAVRGMFNDRRMAVREEQKAAESAVQQIHYKITVLLNSDAKSEIEGVRWVLIRRSVLGILFMAVLMFGSLRYASYLRGEREREREREEREQQEREREREREEREREERERQ